MKRNFTSKINENRPGYKETFAGWIPNDWKYVRAQDITELSAGGTPSTSVDEYWGGDILWMRSGDLNLKRVCDVKGRITNKGLENSSAILIPKHSVLIGLAGQGKTRGTVAINEVELAANQSVAAFIPDKTKTHYLYIFYDLEHRYNELRRLSTGEGGRGGLNLKILGNLRFALPPLIEQQEIVEILTTWNKAIDLVGKQIEAKQRLKKWLMQQLLTGKMRFPGFDDEWDSVKLGEIGDFSKGSGIRKSELLEYGIPCIRYGEIYTSHDFVIKEFYSFISLEVAATSTNIFNGDILFAGSGETPEEIGKCVAYLGEEEAYTGGDVIVLRLSKGDPRYMGYSLNHDVVNRQKYMYGQGHSVVHIYSRFLKDIEIPFPPIEEQKKIAGLLDAVDLEIDRLYHKLFFMQQLKQGLMQKLLTGEVRVKV